MAEKKFIIDKKKAKNKRRIPFTLNAPVKTKHRFFCLLKIHGRVGNFPFRLITPSMNVYGITKVKYKNETRVHHVFLYTPEGIVPMRKESKEYSDTFVSLIKFEQGKAGKYTKSVNRATAFKTWEAIPEEIQNEVFKILTAEMS